MQSLTPGRRYRVTVNNGTALDHETGVLLKDDGATLRLRIYAGVHSVVRWSTVVFVEEI